LSTGKNDIWMPLYIGDYLADTMHLTTLQHGAYLLLLFHLWRRGVLPDDDTTLAKVTGLTPLEWVSIRPALASFFKIGDGLWQHSRVERERSRIAARQESLGRKGKAAAEKRWAGHASGIRQALPENAIPEPQSESEPDTKPDTDSKAEIEAASTSASRHRLFRSILAEYWKAKNHASPEMPWQGRDAKALSDLLAACPHLTEDQFRLMLANRARSPVAHGDRVFLWIANITRFQEEMTVYNRPASAGGYATRAEINRDSVYDAVSGAWELAQEHAGGTGQAGAKPTGATHRRMLVADG
jgi:uncharacterized protein YdaU (DUF1376 family)